MKTLNQIIRKAVKLVLVAVVAISAASIVRADAPAISGYVDTTYNYNFNKPRDNKNVLRLYDNQSNTFLLNAVHLAFTGTLAETGYVIEIDGGNDAQTNNAFGTGGTSNVDIQEAYLTQKFGKFGAKVGKFATSMGIEVIESKDNPTISRGYLYHWAEPYTHTGLMLSLAPTDKIDLGLGVVNGWDNAKDNNTGKTALAKVGLNFGDALALTITGSHGSEQADTNLLVNSTGTNVNGNNRDTLDFTAVTKIIPKTALWLQYLTGTEEEVIADASQTDGAARGNWSGFGIQPVVTITDKFSIGARYEYFDDKDNVKLPFVSVGPGHYTNFSIAPAFKVSDNFLVRVEYRYDMSNKQAFVKDNGSATDSQSVGTAQFVVTF